MKLKKKPLVINVAIALAAILASKCNGQVLYGIDVSHYQSRSSQNQPLPIDWNLVRGGTPSRIFAFIKSSEGDGSDTTDTDIDFRQNIDGAYAAQLVTGPYHLGYPDLNLGVSGAQREAVHFLEVAGDYISSGYLRPTLDIETDHTGDLTKLADWIDAWMAVVHARMLANNPGQDVYPILYVGRSVANSLPTGSTKYPLWIADKYAATTDVGYIFPWTVWRFHQYWFGEFGGSCPGVYGPKGCDLDVFNGNLNDLQSYVMNAVQTSSIQVVSESNGIGIPNCPITIDNSAAGTTDSDGRMLLPSWICGNHSIQAVFGRLHFSGVLNFLCGSSTSVHNTGKTISNSADDAYTVEMQCDGSCVDVSPLGNLAIGDSVEVFGTGNGLRARYPDPCSDSWIVMSDGSIGTIVGGPQCCNGYIRWQIRYNDLTGIDLWSAEGEPSTGQSFLHKQQRTAVFEIIQNFPFPNPPNCVYPTNLVGGNDGKLYGIASGGDYAKGLIFSINLADENNVTILHSFSGYPQDGAWPTSMIQATDGDLYGTTSQGGANNVYNPGAGSSEPGNGAVFVFHLNTGIEELVHSFNVQDGEWPYGELIQGHDGILYGATMAGASTYWNAGGLFSVNPFDRSFRTLRIFTTEVIGNCGLAQADNGKIFGASEGLTAGIYLYGWLFSFDPTNNSFATLQSLADGGSVNWHASLTSANSGKLYGVTANGGANGLGRIFTVDPSTGQFSVVHDFAGAPSDGQAPEGKLLLGSDGRVYGTTWLGGSNPGSNGSGAGTIFTFDPATSQVAVLHNFSGPDGENPTGSLIELSPLNFFGITNGGGASGYGVLFRLSFEAPDISSIEPNPVSGSDVATTLTVNGKNFVTGTKLQIANATSGYTFVTTDSPPTYVNSKTLTVSLIMSTQPDTWHVRAINPDGQSSSTYINLVVNATPTMTNISTRGSVGTGDNVLIGGFVITGVQPKKIIVRAIGPSLSQFGVAGALADPTLELHNSGGGIIATNNNWKDSQQVDIQASGLAPHNDLESAIVITLNPGAYTAIVRGVDGSTGVALVESYDLDRTSDSKLANISTRGLVQTGDNVMIGGLIVKGINPAKVIIRALGPSLSQFGITNSLQDPTLELHDGNGALTGLNDNWKDSQQSDIQATGLQPSDNAESAILTTLSPGAYTAIVRGKNNTSGVALVEAYQLGN